LRRKSGLTQKVFAQHIGKVNYTYIGKIERGEQYPSLKMLKKWGKLFLFLSVIFLRIALF
ncbi:MAG: helix-turn-helix transcriptional regulator, partial [Candidatus Aerophobetes bacterium]|nr:helix-turn-helix transcriptional regulator [Candidatus Aerophobetes bacterium]